MQHVTRLVRQQAGAAFVVLVALILTLIVVTCMGFDLRYFSTATMGDTRDGWFNQWTIYQAMDNLLHRPTNLGYSTIFYGEPSSFANTIAPYGIAFFTLPVFLASQNMELTYNVYFVATFVLTAWTGYLLVRYMLKVTWIIAAIAAMILAFCPYRAAQTNHIESLSMQFYLLALYSLHRLIDRPRIRWAVILAVCFSLTALSSAYSAVALVFMMVIIVLYLLTLHSEAFTPRFITMLVAAAIIGIGLVWPFFSFRLANQGFRAGQPVMSNIDFAASPLDWFSGATAIYLDKGQSGFAEAALFLGITPMALWVVAWRTRKTDLLVSTPDRPRILSRRDVITVYAILAVVGYIMTLGPVLKINDQRIFPLPYIIFYQLPGFAGMRVPARFVTMALAGTAIAAAAALQWIRQRTTRRIYYVILVIVMVGLGVELYPPAYFTLPDGALTLTRNDPTAQHGYFKWLPRETGISPVNAWLSSQPLETPIFQFPLNPVVDVRYIAEVLLHGQPMINGNGSMFPEWYNAVNWNDFGNPGMMVVLHRFKIRYVIVHHHWLSDEDEANFEKGFDQVPAGALRFVGAFGTSVVYEITR